MADPSRVVQGGLIGYRLDALGLFTLGPVDEFEADFLAAFQGLEAFHFDIGKMCEYVVTGFIGLYETVTLAVIEPLHNTALHFPVTSSMDPPLRAGAHHAEQVIEPFPDTVYNQVR
jgi:hypothetical protein